MTCSTVSSVFLECRGDKTGIRIWYVREKRKSQKSWQIRSGKRNWKDGGVWSAEGTCHLATHTNCASPALKKEVFWGFFWDCGYLNSAVSLQLRETDTKKRGLKTLFFVYRSNDTTNIPTFLYTITVQNLSGFALSWSSGPGGNWTRVRKPIH